MDQGRAKAAAEAPAATAPGPAIVPTNEGGRQPEDPPGGRLTPGSRAIAAALDLKNEGRPVSLKAACERAKVDRKNIRKLYPDAAKAIRTLADPDRSPRRGARDRRTGTIDAVDEDEA